MALGSHASPLSEPAVEPTAPGRLRKRVRAFAADAFTRGPRAGTFDRSTSVRTRRTWAFDLAAIAFSILFAVSIQFDRETADYSRNGLLLAAHLIGMPIALGLLPFRRRWPLEVAAALAVVSALVPGAGFAAIVATYAVGAYARPAAAMVGIAAMQIVVPISALLWPDVGADGSFWGDVAFGVVITLGAGAWGLYAGARRELMATLEERAVRAETEQALRVDQARAQERTRIAREMHDVLAHRMSLLSIHAGALEFRPDAPPADIARAAGVIRATAHDALEELRTVIGVMRVGDALAEAGDAEAGRLDGAGEPMAPEPPQPTLSAVPLLVQEWAQAGARIDLDLDQEVVADLPPALGRTAYRIVQEALTNAGKHAPTAKVDVHVGGAPGGSLVVTVTNPLGVGLQDSPIPGTGLGLVGLRERTELAGGVFAAGIDEDLRRFVLEARLPWPQA